jgi:hypothetical protein
MLTSDQKGNIAEAAILAAAVKLGIDVYRPFGEGGRYDMIFGSLIDFGVFSASGLRATATSSYCGAIRLDETVKVVFAASTWRANSTLSQRTALTMTSAISFPTSSSREGRRFTYASAAAGTTNTLVSTGQAASSSPLHWQPQGP